MKNFKRNVDGITLIALVVTIVVLLILAGVSITAVFGDNGLIQMAKKAAEETKKTSEEEQRQLTIAEATMNLNGTKYKSTYKGEEVTVPIPAGFAVSQVDGENTVEEGLVIIDSEGNEFVWIPVKNREDYKKEIGKYNVNIISQSSSFENINEVQKGDRLQIKNLLGTEIDSSIQQQPEIDIVVNAGGFYVGRYEAGVEVNEKIDYDENPEIVVKRNVQPARACPYEKVIELANNWKIGENVQSGLITGTQWDVMCKFIGLDRTNGNCGSWANYRTTPSYGYSGYYAPKSNLDWVYGDEIIKLGNDDKTENNIMVFPTGSFLTLDGKDTKQKNIYDVAGNVEEYTTELSMSEWGAINIRGGNAWSAETESNALIRNGSGRIWYESSDWEWGFRIVLYVK